MNDFMSFGLHRWWKDELLRISGIQPMARALRANAPIPHGDSTTSKSNDSNSQSDSNSPSQSLLRILDVAGGTGDVAFRFLQAAECIERTKSSNPAALMKFPLPSVISIPTCYASVNVVLATCLEMPYLMRV